MSGLTDEEHVEVWRKIAREARDTADYVRDLGWGWATPEERALVERVLQVAAEEADGVAERRATRGGVPAAHEASSDVNLGGHRSRARVMIK